MKLITIVIALTAAFLICVYGQAPNSGAIKKVHVTAQTIASLKADTPYVIDLTRSGTVYDVAPGINYSRVQIRASTGGVLSLQELHQKAGASGRTLSSSRNLLLGTATDMNAVNFPTGGTLKPSAGVLSCLGSICFCKGDYDCNRMFEKDICPVGSAVICSGSGSTAECWCFKTRS